MARKRKSHKGHRRGRRVGALGGDTTKIAAGAAVGALGGRFLSQMSIGTTITPTIKSLVLLAGGFFLISKAKTPLMKGVGAGLVGAGAIGEGQAFGLITGIGAVNNFGSNRNLSLASRVPVVAGFPQPGVVGSFPSPGIVGSFPSLEVVGGIEG